MVILKATRIVRDEAKVLLARGIDPAGHHRLENSMANDGPKVSAI